MAQRDLLDRIHVEMLGSGRPWTAGEIAETFLKMRCTTAQAGPLIRAMIGRDPRFAAGGGEVWSARAKARRSLDRESWLLAWVETGDAGEPDRWRLHLRQCGGVVPVPRDAAAASVPLQIVLDPRVPAGWEAARRRWAGWRCAGFQAGLLGRLLQWMSRRWAIPEWDEPLDLAPLARLALVQEGVSAEESGRLATPSALVARWSLGALADEPDGVPLPAAEAVLEALLARLGEFSEEEIRESVAAALGSRPVRFDDFAFGPRDLEEVPDASGIYRFYDRADRLLYVGKAVRLRRRLASYFRPLPPGARRREELLSRLWRFEVEPLPSELEALLRETRAIRTEEPPWNVQIEVHPVDDPPAAWRWPLTFIARGDDPARQSALVLSDLQSGWLFHLPRPGVLDPSRDDGSPVGGEEVAGASDGLGLWFGALLARTVAPGPLRAGDGEPDPPPVRGAWRLGPSEARLAVRYFAHAPERIEALDTSAFADGASLAAALLELAATSPPATMDAGSGDR